MERYNGVLKRVRTLEEKKGIKYAKKDGSLYNTLNVLSILAAIWGVLMNLIFSLARYSDFSGTKVMVDVKGQIITVIVCTVIIIATILLNKLKFLKRFKIFSEVPCHIISASLNLITSLWLILLFADLSRDELGFLGVKTFFYFRHLVPLALMSIFLIWMALLVLRAEIKTNKMYNKVLDNLYETYRKDNEDADISDEKWDEYLKNYDPDEKKEEKSKRRFKGKIFSDDEKD